MRFFSVAFEKIFSTFEIMLFDTKNLSEDDCFKLMDSVIVPRPIAWILTKNKEGRVNLAPFSWFNLINDDPPMLAVSIARREDNGEKKDTWRNVEDTGSFVVHMPSVEHKGDLLKSAEAFPYGESETDCLNLPLAKESNWDLPRLAFAPVALLCRRWKIIPLNERDSIALILGEIQSVYVSDDFILPDGSMNVATLNPLSQGNGFRGLGQMV